MTRTVPSVRGTEIEELVCVPCIVISVKSISSTEMTLLNVSANLPLFKSRVKLDRVGLVESGVKSDDRISNELFVDMATTLFELVSFTKLLVTAMKVVDADAPIVNCL